MKKRIIAFGLVVMMLVAMVPEKTFAANQGLGTEFTYFQLIVNSDMTPSFIGYFLQYGDDIYIREDSLSNIGGIQEVNVSVDENLKIRLERLDLDDSMEMELTEEDLVRDQEYIYYPVEKVFETLRLRGSFLEQGSMFAVEHGENIQALKDDYKEIYDSNLYDMGELDGQGYLRAMTVATDVVKNLKFFSYATGKGQLQKYETAFTKSLFPTEKNDNVELMESGHKTMTMVGKLAGLYEETDMALETIGCFSLFAEISDVYADWTEDIPVESFIQVYAYAKALGEINERYVDGAELLVKDTNIQLDDKLVEAGENIVNSYRKEEPVWQRGLETALNETFSKQVDNVLDYDLFLGKLGGEVVDITNDVCELLLKTQEQVDAALNMYTCRDIVKACGAYYKYYIGKVSKNDPAKAEETMEKIHKVMSLYLRASTEAHRSAAIDSDLKASSTYAINIINQKLTEFASYESMDFRCARDTKESCEAIKKVVSKLAEQGDLTLDTMDNSAAGNSDTSQTGNQEEPLVLIFGSTGVDGALARRLEVTVQATLPNGETYTIVGGSSAEKMVAADGSLIASTDITGDETGRGDHVYMYRQDATYVIELFDVQSLEEEGSQGGIKNLNISVSTEGKELSLGGLVEDECIYRAPTGAWLFVVKVENGKVTAGY